MCLHLHPPLPSQILAGDMNAEPHEPALRALADPLAPSSTLTVPAAVCGGTGGGAAQAEPVPGDAADKAASAAADPRVPCPMASIVARSSALLTPPPGVRCSCGACEGPIPTLHDAWLAAHGGAGAEPAPRDPDAAVRRHALTFPSDDPVKRIDLVFVGEPGGSPLCDCGGGASANTTGAGRRSSTGRSGGGAASSCVSVLGAHLEGQDPIPLSEASEGRGLGMAHPRAPVYASDHRAVVVDVQLIGEGGGVPCFE